MTVITLERGMCFGTCPVYTVSVDDTGEVTWEGQHFVEHVGTRTWKILPDKLQSILDEMGTIDFFSFADEYMNAVFTDCPSVTVSIRYADGRYKSIKMDPSDYESPSVVLSFAERLDRLLGTKRYIGDYLQSLENKRKNPTKSFWGGLFKTR